MNIINNKANYVVVFLVGVIAGLGLSQFTSKETQKVAHVTEDGTMVLEENSIDINFDGQLDLVEDSGVTASSSVQSKELSLTVKGENVLVISNQPAGISVVMSMIDIDTNGWVAIHENIEGEPGVILGARRFDVGTYFAESVELLRGTESERGYIAVLHADNGDKEFDFKAEVPVKDILGNLIAEEFLVTSVATQE